jgi:hypothetical protein
LPNNASARDPSNWPFIDAEVAALLTTWAIKMGEKVPHVVSPLQVVLREEKEPRLILDVSRLINEFIEVDSVRLVTLQKVFENGRAGDWFASTDMRKGYYHLKIHSEYRDLFGFEWKGQFYRWVCCFLGLKD